MKTEEFKLNQLNFNAPEKTVKLSAVAAAAMQTNESAINILEQNEESFKDFWEWQYVTYRVAKVLWVSDSKIWKNVLPWLLEYLWIKTDLSNAINDSNYSNTIPLSRLA